MNAFATIGYFENSDVPFIVAVSMFDGELVHEPGAAVRDRPDPTLRAAADGPGRAGKS